MAVRWRISFKSMKGVSCRVDIDDPEFPSYLDPKQIKGAADPFFFEEGDSNDLLNDVVRYRTGYIRIVDEGEPLDYISEIYPTNTFDRYVEVYYGSELMFNGYIQVQDFENVLIPTPKIREFQVISPLGLFDQRRFSSYGYGDFLPPRVVTLGEVLDTILYNSHYQYVYVPQNSYAGLWQTIFSLVISPWNKDYHHSMTVLPQQKVMAPESYMFVIEAICKAFGWICHDTPTALVFTSFDYENHYWYYPVGHIGDNSYRSTDSTTPISAELLTNSFDPADDNAIENVLQPETGIEIDYEGESGDVTFSFDRTYFVDVVTTMTQAEIEAYPAHVERFALCNLSPIPGVNEISSSVSAIFYFDSEENLSPGVGVVAWKGHEGIMISRDWSHPNNHHFFTLKFYTKKRSNQIWKVDFDVLHGLAGAIGGLKADENDEIKQHFYASIDSSNTNYVVITLSYIVTETIVELPADTIVLIHNIRLEVLEHNEAYADYRYTPASDADFIRQNDNSPVSNSITMPISLYRQNTHQIGDTLLSTKLTEYPYLFQRRYEMVHKFRLTGSIPVLYHTRLFSYYSKYWRIIAAKFRPWDDEYTLTMQSSPVLSE